MVGFSCRRLLRGRRLRMGDLVPSRTLEPLDIA